MCIACLVNCADDTGSIQEQPILEKPNILLEKLDLVALSEDDEFANTLSVLRDRFEVNKFKTTKIVGNTLGRSTTELADDLTLYTTEINKITVDGTITWTFEVETNVLGVSDFENFMVRKHQDSFTYYLVSYNLNPSAQAFDEVYDNARLYPIDGNNLILDNLDLSSRNVIGHVPPDDGGGGVDNGCDGVLMWDYSPCSSGGTSPHGPVCQHSATNPHPSCNYVCTGTPTLYLDFSHCPSNNPSGPGNGYPPPDGENPPSTGGAVGGGDPPVVTSPVNFQDPRCPEGSGKVMVNEVCICPPNSNKIENSNGDCVCPPGKIENKSGRCVVNPCRHITLQIQNPTYTDYANILKTKTGNDKETGYRANKDGSVTPLNDTLNDGHSLYLPVDRPTTTGYMYTHIDNINAGDLDGDGIAPDFKKSIKMFSPADIIKFL